MNHLRDIFATTSLSQIATRYWEEQQLPSSETVIILQEEQALLTDAADPVAFLFYEDTLFIRIMTAAGCLLVLFLTSFSKPFAIFSAKRRLHVVKSTSGSESKDAAADSEQQQLPQWSQLWNDVTSPLTYFMTNNFDTTMNETDMQLSLTPRPCQVLHICFLLHGHRGYSQDLDYLAAQMRRVAQCEFDKQDSAGGNDDKEESKDSSNNCTTDQALLLQDMVVHAATCNERKTTDGVENGGERAIQEMIDVISQCILERQALETETIKCTDITISVLGNSLGGIYARYAIAKLAQRWNCTQEVDTDPSSLSVVIHNRTYRVHYNVFCTTATPHLGIAGHTFLPIPRTAEIGVAMALGDTGRDLFRVNDLLRVMATSRDYLEPLGRFRKRIAYANAYGTDFPVPAHTAAFLSETSSYPHHFNKVDDNEVVVQDNGLIVATLHTPASSEYSAGNVSPDLQLENWDDSSEDQSELELMSQSLDSLGWKKVFIDVRKEIPKIALPTNFIRKTMTQMTGGGEKDSEGLVLVTDEPSPELIHQLRERGVVGSKDIAAAVTVPLFDEQFHWPMGHNMIVAFSRSKLSTYLNKAGRPVVDALAKALVEDIFAWQPPQPLGSGIDTR